MRMKGMGRTRNEAIKMEYSMRIAGLLLGILFTGFIPKYMDMLLSTINSCLLLDVPLTLGGDNRAAQGMEGKGNGTRCGQLQC